MEDIINIVYFDKKGRRLDTVEKFYIYKETTSENQ